MNPKYLRILEFDKIRARVAAHTSFSASAVLAHALTPSADANDIARRQAETTEARLLLDQNITVGVQGARDVRPLTQNARRGALLTPNDLLDIRQTLLVARTLRRSLTRLALCPHLAERAATLVELPALVQAIERAINDRAEVVDTASDDLARIRQELNTQRARWLEKLQRIIQSPTNTKFLQEPIITERDGRYVIPIRAEAKGRIPGIVHDTSASGATLFIEPLVTVEIGNRVRELERAEAREVERILRELAARVAADADTIDANVAILAELDLAFAKAKYSAEIDGIQPEMRDWRLEIRDERLEIRDYQSPIPNLQSPISNLQLHDARHPLLDPQTVVPISIRLGGEFSILVITGPNTGGKTVTLKTVGLLALMAQSGLHIPARAGSRLPIFSGIYADIGDEQSIEQSLSTFSGHLKNIIEILRDADARSLVLLDELGAGTDPVEGAALARAILQHLLKRNIHALVATHYAELKAFAQTTPGVQNASVEFDVETLAPTYRLTIGLPGQSNALAIAARLGLDADIIAEARRALTRSDVELETMLADIKRAQQEIASAQAHAELARREAEQRAAEARRQLAEIQSARADILQRAREEAQSIIELAREELNRLRQEWQRAPHTREAFEQAHAQLDALEEQLPAPQPSVAPPPRLILEPAEIQVGDRVWLARLGQVGEVMTLDDDEAEVQVGNFRVRVKRDELGERVVAPMPRAESVSVTLPQVESPVMEISLRGMRAEEALEALEKYLDRAYRAGLPYVRVVHGKGTGTLRKLTRDHLRAHPLVASIREAEEYEGGEGVTIAKLVSRA
ncbi:MAG: Smr/MutS family protein [Anaerolineae bacterium]|nr:Smr/MutS family protein [Anaerolineae bacterium]